MSKTTTRQNWGHANTLLPHYDLAQVQVDSYNEFLTSGVRDALLELNPVKDFTGNAFSLEFVDHHFGPATHSPDECVRRGLTFEAPLRVKATLLNLETKQKSTQ